MPDEKKNDQPDDVVKKDDYNKMVEAHNTVKAEKEKIEKELGEIKQNAEAEDKKKVDEEKATWEKEKVDMNKTIEDLKKGKEGDKADPKGIVNPLKEPPKPEGEVSTEKEIKELLDKEIPDREKTPEKFGSNIKRYLYYKEPTTKQYTEEQLGMGLSLHAGDQNVNPRGISPHANKSSQDIVFNKK